MSRYIKVYKNALPDHLCDRLIAKFEKEKAVKADPQPDYSKRRFVNISNLKHWAELDEEVSRYVHKITQKYFKLPKAMNRVAVPEWGDDGFVMACYDVGHKCVLHVDGQSCVEGQNQLRIATFLFYLNSVEKGGETHFPSQQVKIRPEKGKAIIFPPMHTHPHEVLKTTSPRYILQTWITDPNLLVIPRS